MIKRFLIAGLFMLAMSANTYSLDYAYSSTEARSSSMIPLLMALLDTDIQPQSHWGGHRFRSRTWYFGRSIRRFFTYSLPILPTPKPTPEQYVKDNVGKRSEQSIIQYLVQTHGLSHDRALQIALQNSPPDVAAGFLQASLRLAPADQVAALIKTSVDEVPSDQHAELLQAALTGTRDRAITETIVTTFLSNADLDDVGALARTVMESAVGKRNPEILATLMVDSQQGERKSEVVLAVAPYLPAKLNMQLVDSLLANASEAELPALATRIMALADDSNRSQVVAKLLAAASDTNLAAVIEAVANSVTDEQLQALSPQILAAIPAGQRDAVMAQANIKMSVKNSDDCCYIDPDLAMIMTAITRGTFRQQMERGDELYLPGDWPNMIVSILGEQKGKALVDEILDYIGAEQRADDVVVMSIANTYAQPVLPETEIVLEHETDVESSDESTLASLTNDQVVSDPPTPVSPE